MSLNDKSYKAGETVKMRMVIIVDVTLPEDCTGWESVYNHAWGEVVDCEDEYLITEIAEIVPNDYVEPSSEK